MSTVIVHQTITAEGSAAGANQSEERPFGDDGGDGWGNRLHAWMFDQAQENHAGIDQMSGAAAHIMGRNMFGPVRGEWDRPWNGWWGGDPAFQGTVFVLPHHKRWGDFLANLGWVVVDEAHTYRGVFGSHVANVLRRLRRVARLYGAEPRFVFQHTGVMGPDGITNTGVIVPGTGSGDLEGITGDGTMLADEHGNHVMTLEYELASATG